MKLFRLKPSFKLKVNRKAHRQHQHIIFAIQKCGFGILVQWLNVILSDAGGRTRFIRAAASVLRACVQAALEIDDWPMYYRRGAIARTNAVALYLIVWKIMEINESLTVNTIEYTYKFIRMWIRPIVVWRFGACKLQRTGSDQERTKYGAIIWIGDQRITIIEIIGIVDQILNYFGKTTLIQRQAYPQVSAKEKPIALIASSNLFYSSCILTSPPLWHSH